MLSALIHRIKPVLPALLILCLMAALPALAVETPVMAQISISPNEMSEPGPVDVSISVKNISGADLTQPVTLYDPYGRLVAGFGQNGSATLKADAEMTVSLQDTVSQEMIDQGSMTYTLRWLDESGQELAVPVTAEVHFSGEKAGLRIVRTITPEVVRSGQTVKVSYELTNTGSVSISNIQVREKLSRTPKTLKNLAKGATSTVEFTAKMGNADLISSAEITYKPAGTGKSETAVIEAQTIPTAVKGLKVELSVDKTAVDIGDTFRLILTARNEGNISYHDISAVDKKLGTVFEGLSVPAFSTITEEKAVTVNEPSSFQLKLTLQDNTGMTNTLDTNAVSVSAYDPEKELLLTLLLTSDKESITGSPEDVSMTVVVTNTSNVDCKNVEITQNAVSIYTIPTLAAGQSVTVKRDFTVSQAGAFRFTATTKDTIGNTVHSESNPLTLNYSLGALAAITLILFIASSIVRARKRHQSDSAYDHLDLAERRDYSQIPEDSGEPAAPKKPAPAGKTEETPAEDAGTSLQTEGGGFRMTRDRQTADFPTWREPAGQAPAEETAAMETPAAEAPAEPAPAAPEAPQTEVPVQADNAAPHDRTSLPDRRRRRSRS